MTRPVALVRATAEDRVAAGLLLAGLAAWMAYTRVFWTLHGLHATLPACPFLALTGQPCPLCGGTRAFASMWEGDVGRAVRFHPLGPALFAGTFAAAAAALVLLLSGRALRVRPDAQKRLQIAGFAIFGAAWALRLVLLPLP